MLKMDAPKESARKIRNRDNSKLILDDKASHRLLAKIPPMLFVINPVVVFSAAAYLESLFAILILTFTYHAIAAGGECCRR